MNAYYIYILECVDSKGKKTYYTGYTSNLAKRFQEHVSGNGAKYTKGKQLKIVHYEIFTSRKEAMRREREIKAMSLKDKMDLINGTKKKKK
ncbi:MAG: GIY-YIG nuclease family protein [Promethearchaeota archaeon]